MHIKRIFIAVLVLALVTIFAGCQTPATEQKIKPYERNTANPDPAAGRRNFVDTEHLKTLAGTTVALTLADRKVRQYAVNGRNNTTDEMSKTAMMFGDKKIVLYSSLGIYEMSHALGSYRTADTALMVAEASYLANKTSNSLKLMYPYYRPGQAKNNLQSQSYPASNDYPNKPPYTSNHTTTAFAWASVIANRTDNSTIALMSYVIAGSVGMARVYQDDHWLSDIWLSAGIGMVIGTGVVKLNESYNLNRFLSPMIEPDFIGLGMHIMF
jgi:hypothetical protein